MLLLTAYFVTTLAERMRKNERSLEVLADRAVAGQRLLERALETTSTGLRVLDGDLGTRWANNLWQEWFHRASGSASFVSQLLDGEHSPARQCLQDGEVRVTESAPDPQAGSPAPAQGPGTAPRVFQVTTAPLRDAAGRIQQIVELAEDVTPHKHAQARMVRAGTLAAVGQLAGQVAHEVNNPIAIISGKARLLLSDHQQDMTPMIARELRAIAEAAERVARIAQGLLSHARPSRGDRTRLDVRLPVRRSLALIEEAARRIGVGVEDSLPEVRLPVHANSNELEQVFLNLFLNALDAMPNGGRLRVSAQTANGTDDEDSIVAIAVEDTGGGIAPEVRDRIFEPFFTTKREGRGTGLGLSICRGLVRSHKGSIRVESQPGAGTRFVVSLPVDVAKRPAKEPEHA